jgi:hypothetical protein
LGPCGGECLPRVEGTNLSPDDNFVRTLFTPRTHHTPASKPASFLELGVIGSVMFQRPFIHSPGRKLNPKNKWD